METKYNFTKLSRAELLPWLLDQKVKRKVTKIQQHHTYLPNYSHFNGSNHFERQKAMQYFHVNNQKWNDIAQQFTTFPDGTVLTGRSLEQTPVGIYGQNTGAICIENFGDFDLEEINEEHQQTIITLTAALCIKFNISPGINTIIYHSWYDLKTGKYNLKSLNRKTCPGVKFFGGNKPGACRSRFIPLIYNEITYLLEDRTSKVLK